jgi:hypothetical protein
MEQQQYSMRMVIIPEEVYTSLLNQNKSLASPLDAHILESSNKLNEILNSPNLDDSTKFQLYSNEMKRLQKVRADRSEQPSIKSVAPDIAAAQQQQQNTPKRVRKKSSPSGIEEEEESEEPHDFETPQKQSPRAERRQKFEALRNYLDENRQRFGIREDGFVFKDPSHSAIYVNGKFENIAKALTGLTSRRPPGLQRLLESIRDDEYARQLILDFDSPRQKGKGAIRTQSPPITRLSPPPPQCQKNIKTTNQVHFCPEIWH